MTKKLALVASLIGLAAGPAFAGTLYSNGPLNGAGGPFGISNGYAVSDSFTVSGSATVTSLDFAVWNLSGDVTASIGWSIGTALGGSQLGSGAGVTPSGVLALANAGWDVYIYTISGLNVPLPGSGTYYLTLQNAVAERGGAPDGDFVYWDENDGPSAAYQDYLGGAYYTLANNDARAGGVCANGQVNCTGSETFNIYGSSSASPEPASPILFGSGLLLLAGALRRKAGSLLK